MTDPVPFPYALSAQSALLDILAASLRRAVSRGLITHVAAETLFARASASDSAFARIACEVVLGRLEGRRVGEVENST